MFNHFDRCIGDFTILKKVRIYYISKLCSIQTHRFYISLAVKIGKIISQYHSKIEKHSIYANFEIEYIPMLDVLMIITITAANSVVIIIGVVILKKKNAIINFGAAADLCLRFFIFFFVRDVTNDIIFP